MNEARVEREAAERDGDEAAVARLDAELAQVEDELHQDRELADAGERARDNVRKAIERVRNQLRKGGADERALAVHLGNQVSTGFEVMYVLPPGGHGWQ